ncbi:MAG: chaperone modulator CbpM [Opitutus sp.]
MNSTALAQYRATVGTVYPIDRTAQIVGLPRRTILRCCKLRLVSPIVDVEYGGYYFDRHAVERLHRIAYLHTERAVDLRAVEIIIGLMNEVERLREALDRKPRS